MGKMGTPAGQNRDTRKFDQKVDPDQPNPKKPNQDTHKLD